MPTKTTHWHSDPAQFDHNILTLGKIGNSTLPLGEDLVLLACVRTNPQRPTNVIKDNLRIGESLSKIYQVGKLGMV